MSRRDALATALDLLATEIAAALERGAVRPAWRAVRRLEAATGLDIGDEADPSAAVVGRRFARVHRAALTRVATPVDTLLVLDRTRHDLARTA